MASEIADALIGSVVAERYHVLRRLGQGGMGAVYEVEHLLIGRRFALKKLHAEFTRDADVIARFHREARAAAAIGDEHIIEVSDMGSLPDGSPFIVLELLSGQDLGELLRATGPMSLQRAIGIVRQACGALGQAHAKGIVHRDIKPDNIFILQRHGQDFIKLLDFGISKLHESAMGLGKSSLTKTGAALGTPHYMAPEQMRGDQPVDARADVYAMGVVLFELLMGRVPFDATNYPGLVIKVMQEEPPSMRGFRRDVPAELEAVVLRAMAKDPDQRFSSIEAFANALAKFEAFPNHPPNALHAAPTRPLSITTTPKTWETDPKPEALPRAQTPKYLIAALAFAGVVGVAFWLTGGRGASDSANQASGSVHMVHPAPVADLPPQPVVMKPTAASATQNVEGSPNGARAPQAANAAPTVVAAPSATAAPTGVGAPAKQAQPPPVSAPLATSAASGDREPRGTHQGRHASPESPAAARPPPASAAPAKPQLPPLQLTPTLRSIAIDNQRRASVSVTLSCDGKSYEASVGAMARTVTSVPAANCTVSCRGLGTPYCPLNLPSFAHSIEVK